MWQEYFYVLWTSNTHNHEAVLRAQPHTRGCCVGRWHVECGGAAAADHYKRVHIYTLATNCKWGRQTITEHNYTVSYHVTHTRKTGSISLEARNAYTQARQR